MKFMGSKNRIAKHILPIILKDRTEGQWYVEPMCGGCNIIDKVTGNRLANDVHFELIEMFRALQNGWVPPTSVTEQEYTIIKKGDNHALRGYVGFNMSYAGKWWGGYRRDNIGIRDYAGESFRNIEKQTPLLTGVDFKNASYELLKIPLNSIIYVDPPYRGTTKYASGVDYEELHQWCRDKKAEGHRVFISEYQMPDDFICVWKKPQTSSLTKDTGAKVAIEKLFTI